MSSNDVSRECYVGCTYRYKISRQEQDELAVRSHARAAAAIKSGRFKEEIVPVTVNVKGKPVVFDTDGSVLKAAIAQTGVLPMIRRNALLKQAVADRRPRWKA